MASKFDGRNLRQKMITALGLTHDEYKPYIVRLYESGMSSVEICESIFQQTSIEITPRSIQRVIHKLGKMRDVKTAFRLAIKRGRVVWQAQQEADRVRNKTWNLSPKKRWEIMERDNMKCTVCGITAEGGGLLQVDHIVARVFGGSDEKENLRTFCITCNNGKRLAKKEFGNGGQWKSGEESLQVP